MARKIEQRANIINYDSDLEESLRTESSLTSPVAKKILAENVATLVTMRNYFRLKVVEDRASFADFKLLQVLCTSINREMERLAILKPGEKDEEDNFL